VRDDFFLIVASRQRCERGFLLGMDPLARPHLPWDGPLILGGTVLLRVLSKRKEERQVAHSSTPYGELGRSEIGGCSVMWHFIQRRSLIWFEKRLSNGLMLTPRIRETRCSVCSVAYSLAKVGM
jgi:hypothetical protein